MCELRIVVIDVASSCFCTESSNLLRKSRNYQAIGQQTYYDLWLKLLPISRNKLITAKHDKPDAFFRSPYRPKSYPSLWIFTYNPYQILMHSRFCLIMIKNWITKYATLFICNTSVILTSKDGKWYWLINR